jgi:hypothetical protein
MKKSHNMLSFQTQQIKIGKVKTAEWYLANIFAEFSEGPTKA